jgi:hypothetical protein
LALSLQILRQLRPDIEIECDLKRIVSGGADKALVQVRLRLLQNEREGLEIGSEAVREQHTGLTVELISENYTSDQRRH